MPSASRSPISRNSSAVSPRGQLLVDDQAVACRLHAHQPAFRALVGFGRVAAAVDIEPAMRARPDAGIFVAAPIDQIVPAFGARPRVVGNFVGRQAGLGADRLREVVEIARGVVVGNDELAGFVQTEKRRVRLDGQLIEREMLGRLGNGALELGRPGVGRLARPRIDQIERIALEDSRAPPRPRRALPARCAGGRVPSARHRRAPARRATRG